MFNNVAPFDNFFQSSRKLQLFFLMRSTFVGKWYERLNLSQLWLYGFFLSTAKRLIEKLEEALWLILSNEFSRASCFAIIFQIVVWFVSTNTLSSANCQTKMIKRWKKKIHHRSQLVFDWQKLVRKTDFSVSAICGKFKNRENLINLLLESWKTLRKTLIGNCKAAVSRRIYYGSRLALGGTSPPVRWDYLDLSCFCVIIILDMDRKQR